MTRYSCATHALRYCCLLFVLPGLAGCGHAGRLVFTADDVVAMPNGRMVFAASVYRDFGSSLHKDMSGAAVTFYAGGRAVARAVTNNDGRVVVEGRSKVPAHSFSAVADVDGQIMHTAGTVYHWSPRKTIVAVDIDETISATSYSDLFIAAIDGSKPIRGSAEALWRLSRDYQILYISARPEFLQEKTRQWLRAHRFPPAPYMGADRFEACLHQEAYKRRILAGVKQRWPNLLIGIGDKKVDDGAYGANDMLTLIVNPWPIGAYTQRCVMVHNWSAVTEFFERHAERLSDPAALASVIEQNGATLRVAFAQSPPSTPRARASMETNLVSAK